MTTQNFVTLPREVVEQMLVFMHNKSDIKQGFIADYINLEEKLVAALTEQVQPAQGELPPLPIPAELNPASNSVMGYHEAHLKQYARDSLLQSNAERVPLTPEQRVDIADACANLDYDENFLGDLGKIIDLVEAAHKITKGQQ